MSQETRLTTKKKNPHQYLPDGRELQVLNFDYGLNLTEYTLLWKTTFDGRQPLMFSRILEIGLTEA